MKSLEIFTLVVSSFVILLFEENVEGTNDPSRSTFDDGINRNLSDLELAAKGAELCNLDGREEEAIAYFSEAILKNSIDPRHYINRAQCNFRLKRLNSVKFDCLIALKFLPNHVKAHYLLGSVLLELGSLDEAMKHLQKANDQAKKQYLYYGDSIASKIRLAREKILSMEEEKRLGYKHALLFRLNHLILEDMHRQLNEVDDSEAAEQLNIKCNDRLNKLTSIFDNTFKNDPIRKIPSYLYAELSTEILKEPVITPEGITYEKEIILDHLERYGPFDPITGSVLRAHELTPNLAMKDVVQAFLEENEWASNY